MIGEQQYTTIYTPYNTIVWIVLALPLHTNTINHRGDEGIVELGDDRSGESSNK